MNGSKNDNFFNEKSLNRSSNIDFKPLKNLRLSKNKIERDFYQFNNQNFSSHIYKMIPLFFEVQLNLSKSIIKSNVKNYLDLGCSEGGLLKTVSNNSSIKSIGLETNNQMIKNFEKSKKVKNVQIFNNPFLHNWDDLKKFETKEKFDIITELFLFQFMSNNRREQIKEVKKLLSKNGVFICGEKFTNDNKETFLKNEVNKNIFQSLYFTKDQITTDKKEIIEGMTKDQITKDQMTTELKSNFKHIFEFWQSGNFGGFICSDSKLNIDNFKNNLGYFKY